MFFAINPEPDKVQICTIPHFKANFMPHNPFASHEALWQVVLPLAGKKDHFWLFWAILGPFSIKNSMLHLSAQADFLTQSSLAVCASLVQKLAWALKCNIEFLRLKGPKIAQNSQKWTFRQPKMEYVA